MGFKLPLRALSIAFAVGAALVVVAFIGTLSGLRRSTVAPVQTLGAPAIE